MSAQTPEGRITKRIIDYINGLPRSEARKCHGGPYSGAVGEPDVDACVDGRAVKLEVKQPRSEAALRRSVTPNQRRRLAAWERAGAVVGVVTSVDEVTALLVAAAAVPLPGLADVVEAQALAGTLVRRVEAPRPRGEGPPDAAPSTT